MRIGLIGSVSSSWHVLRAFIDHGVDVACVCGVDESRAAAIGDYRSLRELATGAGIPFLSFVKVSEPQVADFIRRHAPDALWVIGISQLVPDELIARAPQGGIGFHPTMLPRGRGRAPVAWTILLGAPAAVSLFHLTAEADAGDLIYQCEVPVLPDDYSHELIERTNEYLARAVAELAPAIRAGELPRRPQDPAQATFYARRTPADGLIDWRAPTDAIYRLIRAAGRPYPGAFTYLPDGCKLTVWRAQPARAGEPALAAPGAFGGEALPLGQVIARDAARGVLVRTVDGGIWLTEVATDNGGGAERLNLGDVLTSPAENT